MHSARPYRYFSRSRMIQLALSILFPEYRHQPYWTTKAHLASTDWSLDYCSCTSFDQPFHAFSGFQA